MSTNKSMSSTAGELRWKRFKDQPSGVDKIPPTSGAWYQHILRAHMQANIWNQDLMENPRMPDPFTLGWSPDSNGFPIPILSEAPIAPESVIELVRCGCGVSKCSNRCTCRLNNLNCTEICKCGADEECLNTGAGNRENTADDLSEDADY